MQRTESRALARLSTDGIEPCYVNALALPEQPHMHGL